MKFNIGRRPLFVILAAAAFLGGCAQVPKQAYNAAAAAHVKTVVVAQAENQVEYQAHMLAHPGMSFGLIGGLVAIADMQAKSTKLTTAIDPKEVRVQERFSERLTAQLEKAGYKTVVLRLPKDAKGDQALALAKQQNGADAVLVVDLSAGYWAAGPSSDYFPRMVATVKKVDLKSDKVLYQDMISYGYTVPQGQTIHLASDPAYRFKDIDTLVADPGKTREGLYQGLDALAQQIAADLKK